MTAKVHALASHIQFKAPQGVEANRPGPALNTRILARPTPIADQRTHIGSLDIELERECTKARGNSGKEAQWQVRAVLSRGGAETPDKSFQGCARSLAKERLYLVEERVEDVDVGLCGKDCCLLHPASGVVEVFCLGVDPTQNCPAPNFVPARAGCVEQCCRFHS